MSPASRHQLSFHLSRLAHVGRRGARLAAVILSLLSAAGNAAEWTVTTLADELDTPSGNALSLREAIRDAAGGDTLRFAPELNGGTLTLTLGRLEIAKNLSIDAMSLAAGITIDGNLKQPVLYNSAPLTLRGISIIRGLGGGVLSGANLTMEHCVVSACRGWSAGSAGGAGILHFAGAMSLSNCSILSNRTEAGMGGGGIHISSSGSTLLVNCTIADNEAAATSGIHFGGSGTANMIHCTVVNNRSLASSAAVTASSGVLRLQNSVVAGNLAGPTTRRDVAASSGSLQKIGQNFISCNSGVTTLFPEGATVGTVAAPKDALLSAMGFHDGRTPCFLPLSGSKLVHAAITSADTPAQDQRGLARISGPLADLGSVEATGSVFLPANGSAGVTILPVLEWSHQLTASLHAVHFGTAPGSLQPRGTTATGRMVLPELLPAKTYYWRVDSTVAGSTLTGPLQSFTTRPAYIVTKASDETSADLSQDGVSLREAVTLAGANTGFDLIRFHPDLAGIDLVLDKAPLTIGSELRIEGDSLPGGTSIKGGSYLVSSTTEWRGLSLTGGSGGLGTINVTGSLTARNCTVAGNRAANGGGIYLQSGACTLIHCTVTGNTANFSGGGIFRNGGVLTLENSVIAGNRTLDSSPDVRITASLVTRGNNLIGNHSGSETLFPAGVLTGTAASPLDPALAPAGRHAGGLSQYCPPMAGSPAIGKALPLPTTPATDQLGRSRPAVGNPSLGAVELDPGFVLSIPAPGETDALLAPRLCWTQPGEQFEVFVGTSPETLASVGVTMLGSFQLAPFPENTTVYWRVDRTTGGVTTTGPVSSFTTRGPILVTTLEDESDPAPADGTGISLREALGIAFARPGPDRISFSPPLGGGRIVLTGSNLSANSECVIDAMDLAGGITLDFAGARYLSIGGSGDLSIRGMSITGSIGSTIGSALSLSSGVLELSDLAVFGNTGSDGAALRNSSGRLIVNRCVFTGNSGSSGGAIDLSSGISRITNSTFHGNRASTTGGAIRSRGACQLVHCTVYDNLSQEAGGIKVDSSSGCVLTNCIVAGNTATVEPGRSDLHTFVPAQISAQGRNLIGINTGLETVFPAGSLAGTLASPLDPLLLPAVTTGDIAAVLYPAVGSPALDSGLPFASQPDSDQLGAARISGPFPDLGAVEARTTDAHFWPSNLTTGIQPSDVLRWHFEPGADLYRIRLGRSGAPMVDIGTSISGSFNAGLDHGVEYEWQVVAIRNGISHSSPVHRFSTRPRITVTTLVDENDAIPGQGTGISLREAIRLAKTLPGPDEIAISPAVPAGTLVLNGTELVIDSDVTINGTLPAGRLVMDANEQSRLFISQQWDVQAILENLVMRRGNTTGSGGGIANTARMRLTGVDITACSSRYSGGAIYNSGRLEMDECSLLSNEAVENGTAIIATSGSTRIANSTIAHNRQKFLPSVSGYIHCCGIDAKQLELINCTVASNRSARSAIRAVVGDFTHTTVTGNLSHNNTAGIEWITSLAIRNCIIADNFTGGVEGISSVNGVRTKTTYRNDDMVGPASGLLSEGANLVGNNYKLESVLPAGPLIGTPAARLSPRLLDLGNYGGPTPTAPPTGGSPARRAAVPIENGPSRDQRGVTRTVGITPDLGAADQSAVGSAFYPAHAEDAVSCSPRLTWIFETGAQSYEVFAGPAPGAMTSKGSVTTPLLELEELEPLSDVYWKVVASVSGVLVESPVHVFTTRDHLTVTHSGDPLDGEPPGLSLRQAARRADLLPGFDRIGFAPSVVASGIVLAGVPLELSDRFSLVSDHGLLSISGDGRSTVLSIFPGADSHLESLHLHSGSSAIGAGLYISRSKASLYRCEITGNIATGNSGAGAGLYQIGGDLTIDSCLFAGNQADWAGGGIYIGDCNARLRNCTLSGNSAESAAAFYGDGFADLEHCTLVGNRATLRGGAMDLRYWPRLRLANCLIAGNLVIGSSLATPGHDLYSSSSGVEKEGINFIGTNNSCSSFFPTGPTVGNSVTPLDPRLSPLADHGGATRCHLPLTGSPVIGAAIPLAGSPAHDQRGLPRPQGGGPDLGAVEILAIGSAAVDLDADGMDDRLEALWGFKAGIDDGGGDADGDGSTNAEELGNHTNPRDPGDYLRVISSSIQLPPVAGGDVMMHLTWSSFPGLRYTVERSTDLGFGENSIRSLDAGTADAFTRSMTVPLLPGRDFVRIRRD